MTDVQITIARAQGLSPIPSSANQGNQTGESFEETSMRISAATNSAGELTDPSTTDSSNTSTSSANQILSALQSILGGDSTQIGSLLDQGQTDPSQSISDLIMQMMNQSSGLTGTDSIDPTTGIDMGDPSLGTVSSTNPALQNLPDVSPTDGQALYPVPDGTPCAWVDQAFGADSVSSQIVGMASLCLSNMPGGNTSDNIQEISNAMQNGFLEANKQMGAVPADLAQLYNETYNQTETKWNSVVGQLQGSSTASTQSASVDPNSSTYTRPLTLSV